METRKIVRTYSAGVFFGEIVSRVGREVVMAKARRLWYWDGAASLSELAMRGTSKPHGCKFPIAVDRIELLEAIEILDVSEQAAASIDGVNTWTAHGDGYGAGYGDGDGAGAGAGDGAGDGAGYGDGDGGGDGDG